MSGCRSGRNPSAKFSIWIAKSTTGISVSAAKREPVSVNMSAYNRASAATAAIVVTIASAENGPPTTRPVIPMMVCGIALRCGAPSSR